MDPFPSWSVHGDCTDDLTGLSLPLSSLHAFVGWDSDTLTFRLSSNLEDGLISVIFFIYIFAAVIIGDFHTQGSRHTHLDVASVGSK